MNARNLLPFAVIAAFAIAAAGCQTDDSMANDADTDAAIYAPSGNPAMNRSANTPANYNAGGGGNPGGGMSETDVNHSASGSLQQIAIMDSAGNGQPVQAASITIPAGWQAQGGINWNRNTACVSNQMRFQWQATSADGSEAFTVMPGLTWQVQGTDIQMNPCPAMPFRTAKDFLDTVAQQERPGARILQYRSRPMPAPPQLPNSQATSHVEGGELLIAYQSNGQEVREVLSTSVTFTEMQGNIMGGARTVMAFRAPNGRLDFSLAAKIGASLQTNRQWQAEWDRRGAQLVNAYSTQQRNEIDDWNNRRMGQINARGAADRAAIRAGTARDVGNIYSQINANTSATDDRIHRRNLEAIGGYNTYSDPATGNTVQADIGYDRVLGNGNGSYTGTNDPYYNPAGTAELEREH